MRLSDKQKTVDGIIFTSELVAHNRRPHYRWSAGKNGCFGIVCEAVKREEKVNTYWYYSTTSAISCKTFESAARRAMQKSYADYVRAKEILNNAAHDATTANRLIMNNQKDSKHD